MTWSGVTVRTGVTLSGLPEHPRLAPRGSVLSLSRRGHCTAAALWTSRTLKMTRNGATQLTPGPWKPDFFKSF